jgi:tyrosine-protein phosphatase SIW14
MNDVTNIARNHTAPASPGGSAPTRPSGPRRASISPGRARAVALAFLIPLIVPACTSAKTFPRPEKWAQPVASTVLKNWYVVTPDLYRSEQPDRKGFEEVRAQGIRSIVNLRGNHSDDMLVQGLGFNAITVPMTADGFSEEDIVKALQAIKDAPKPVLVHCQHGADRTGVVIAMYRVVFQSWSKEDAIAELKGGGFGFHWYYFNIPSFIKNVDVARIKARLDIH